MPAFTVDMGDAPEDTIEFELRGKTRKGKRWSETFNALGAIPVGMLVDLGDGIMREADAAKFIGSLLIPEDTPRFEKLIRDKDRIVQPTEIAEVLQRLFTAMAGRPTTPSSDSQSGAVDTGTTSKDGSSSPVSTPDPSMAPVS